MGRGELVNENYKPGEFASNSYTKFFYVSSFLFCVSILCVELLRAIVRGTFSPVLNCLEEISMGGISPWRWGHISWNYLKTIRN